MDINQMMKQAQQMQKKFQEAQAKAEEIEVDGTSGGGMVKATVSGKGKVKNISLDSKLVDPEETEMLEDLVVAAINDALDKKDEQTEKMMADVTGGIQMPPGMKMPF